MLDGPFGAIERRYVRAALEVETGNVIFVCREAILQIDQALLGVRRIGTGRISFDQAFQK